MELLICGYKPKGALDDCITFFGSFYDDIEVMVREGYMKVTGPETCQWLKSKTSLAEYFKWTGTNGLRVNGGFWAPIENTFGIKRHSLRKLAGQNANPLKNGPSRDFIKIKPILEKHRNDINLYIDQRRTFRLIRYLILKSEDEKPKTIKLLLETIYKVLTPIVDKNRKNHR
jgi:hypothetical protein